MLLSPRRTSWPRFLLAVLAIPLTAGDHWHALSFGDKPINEIAFVDGAIKIGVSNSSSPLFYHFDDSTWLRSVFVDASTSGLPALPADKPEGSKGADDFALRFGIVLEGKERLNWLERIFAPGWLKQLTDLFPNRGFGGVEFLTLAQKTAVGVRRDHPTSDKLHEEVGAVRTEAGPFTLEKVFPEPLRAMGLWIQSDGDDTRSAFDVVVKSITVTTTSP